MKIAHVSHEFHPAITGVGQVVMELAKRQAKTGHEVYVITSDWDKHKRINVKRETIDGIKVMRCRHIARMGNFANIWPEVFPILLKKKFDIIHSHVFAHVHFVLGAIAAKLTGAKHVHTTHCPWSDSKRSTLGRMGVIFSYNLISNMTLKITDKIIAITPWEVNFIKKFGGEDKKIEVIPNGMDNIFFKKIKNNSFKKKHKIKGQLVLFFGRLSITKGPEKFVEIAHEVLKERPNTTFVLVGPDEGMYNEVKRKIGNEKRILLLPAIRNRNEVAEMYQAADVFLLPSYREGLPLTLFEAMASGPPVVASPVNGVL